MVMIGNQIFREAFDIIKANFLKIIILVLVVFALRLACDFFSGRNYVMAYWIGIFLNISYCAILVKLLSRKDLKLDESISFFLRNFFRIMPIVLLFFVPFYIVKVIGSFDLSKVIYANNGQLSADKIKYYSYLLLPLLTILFLFCFNFSLWLAVAANEGFWWFKSLARSAKYVKTIGLTRYFTTVTLLGFLLFFLVNSMRQFFWNIFPQTFVWIFTVVLVFPLLISLQQAFYNYASRQVKIEDNFSLSTIQKVGLIGLFVIAILNIRYLNIVIFFALIGK